MFWDKIRHTEKENLTVSVLSFIYFANNQLHKSYCVRFLIILRLSFHRINQWVGIFLF